MVRTLKAMPQIDSVKSAVARYGGMPDAYVQYRDRSKAGQGATIRFQTTRQLGPPFDFYTGLPGLSTPGRPPSDLGTGRITQAWKARCNVNAGAGYD